MSFRCRLIKEIVPFLFYSDLNLRQICALRTIKGVFSSYEGIVFLD